VSSETSELWEEVRARLAAAGIADPDGQAELIVRAASEQADEPVRDRALGLGERRVAGEGLAALLGRVRFSGVELLLDPEVIVPRAETELLAQVAIEALESARQQSAETALRAIDMCCGAGNLCCAIAVGIPSARLWACDLTESCVRLTARNVEHLGLGDRVEVLQGDLFEPLGPLELGGRIDLVVCNPPYISSGKLDTDSSSLWQHEPREAFDGGPYGLSVHQKLIRTAAEYLRPGGWLAFEMGLGQERQIRALFARARAYQGLELRADAAGRPRVAVARKKAE